MRPDCLIINFGAVSADSSDTASGTLTAVGDVFNVTRIEAEAVCIFEFSTEGNELDGQNNGFYIPERDGNAASPGGLDLPAPFQIQGGSSFAATLTTLQTAFNAENGRVALIGFWS